MPLTGTLGGIAARIAAALAVGLLIGFEREWANKDAGTRTCALVALLGMLCALVSPALTVAALAGVIALIVLINWRTLHAPTPALEITTSASLLLTYVLGVLVGQGEFFAPVATAIVATLLLAWKVELRRFAGELQPREIRGALWLGALAFVIYPLMPRHAIDPWGLVNPHDVWMAVVIVAAVSFANYILMRLYSARGLEYSAVLGGLVSSAATVMELGSALKSMAAEAGDGGAAILDLGVTVTLLATIAALSRNLLLLAIFFPAGVRAAWLPTLVMAAVAIVIVARRRRAHGSGTAPLHLPSPVEIGKVLEFGLLFLVIQIASNLAHRAFGHFGVYAVSIAGGFFNSAGTIAAVGQLGRGQELTTLTAGVATVLASMATVIANAPLMDRQLRNRRAGQSNMYVAWCIVAAGGIALALGWWLLPQV